MVAALSSWRRRAQAPKRLNRFTFVHEEIFKNLYDNAINAKRFGNLSIDNNEGVETNGHWCKGDFNTDLPGHDLHELYDDQSIEILDEKGDGDVQLTKNSALQIYQLEEARLKDPICLFVLEYTHIVYIGFELTHRRAANALFVSV